MALDEDELRLRLERLAAQVSAPRFAADGLARRIRRRRAGIIAAISGSFLAVAAAAVAVPVGLASPGQRAAHAPGPAGPAPVASASALPPLVSSAPPAAAAPGTVLLTCASANWGQLPSNWRAESLKAGPLWFVYGRQQGYVHDSGSGGIGSASRGHGGSAGDVMIVEVTSGSTVVMKAAPQAGSYFRFLDGFGPDIGYRLPPGDTGFTFIACPRGEGGPNGQVTDFYLGFSIEAGRHALVEVQAPPARPIQVIFTRPG